MVWLCRISPRGAVVFHPQIGFPALSVTGVQAVPTPLFCQVKLSYTSDRLKLFPRLGVDTMGMAKFVLRFPIFTVSNCPASKGRNGGSPVVCANDDDANRQKADQSIVRRMIPPTGEQNWRRSGPY